MAAAALSELFVIDAQHLVGDVQRFARGAPGASAVATASAAESLGDLLRTLELVAYAGCCRTLARRLEAVPAVPEVERARVAELTTRLSAVLTSLRGQQAVADDPAFATTWLAQFVEFAPVSEGCREPPHDVAAPLPAGTAVALSVPAAVGREAASQRGIALVQARRLHDSLVQAHPTSRDSIERVIAQLLVQARVECAHLGAHALAPGLALAVEAFDALARAVSALPAARSARATVTAGVFSIELDDIAPSAETLALAGAAIAGQGGRIDPLPGGLRLSLPCDTRRPSVVVLRDAQGWLAVHALQFEGAAPAVPDTHARGQVSQAHVALRVGASTRHLALDAEHVRGAAPSRAWRYELPEAQAWPLPSGWLALVRDVSGRVMPLLVPPDSEAPARPVVP